MDTIRKLTASRVQALALTSLALFGLPLAAHADIGQTIEVKLGVPVTRSWDDVTAAKDAYGPKQDYDDSSKETHIWLPYGNSGPYYEVAGMNTTDASSPGGSLGVTIDGATQGHITFKFHFDKSIGAFRLGVGWTELGLQSSCAGFEYSTDGQTWKVVKEVADISSILNQLVDPAAGKVGNLKTQDLYIRAYSRDKAGAAPNSGKSYWFKLRMSGDPTWGDASTTFFNSQLQLWVSPAP